jgi:uncharacterized lipoprotein YehR (DUF1307 family)
MKAITLILAVMLAGCGKKRASLYIAVIFAVFATGCSKEPSNFTEINIQDGKNINAKFGNISIKDSNYGVSKIFLNGM